jgi:DMSO reductase anchor subunit
LKHRVIINTGLPELQAAPSGNNTAPSSSFDSLVQTGGSNAYYIDFNPSSLTTIASVTGKFIPYLSSAVTAIAAFFAANTIHKITQNEQDAKLLTPKQMSIMLGLLLSGWQGMWDSICYRVKRGSRFNGPLLAIVITLTVTTILGYVFIKLSSRG